MKIFPRLDDSPALRKLMATLIAGNIDHCRQQRAQWNPGAWYGPSGGEQIAPQELEGMAESLTEIAIRHGYPSSDGRDTRGSDIAMSIHLYEVMAITPVEAANGGIWNFLACIVVPDLIAWRFPVREAVSASGNPDRWIVDRRWYRHALGRLWWRACMFRDPENDDPWHLLRQLQEDEFIQLLERPHLVGYRDAVHHLISAMLKKFKEHQDLNRGTLMRIAAKRLLRLGAVIDLHSLDSGGLTRLMERIATESVASESANARTAHA